MHAGNRGQIRIKVKLDGWGMRSFPTHKPGPFYSVREARPDDHDDRCVRGTADELSAWRDAVRYRAWYRW